jgi:peptidoglycan/LPS O-acetylase OafA/YrhL
MQRITSYDGQGQLPSLTGLRGIAALWVVLYHFGNRYFVSIEPGAAGYVVEKGYLAVDLFFLVSGFVLAHVYLDQFARQKSRAIWPFLQARVARLYPLHLVVLGVFVIDAAIPALRAHILAGEPLHVRMFGAQSIAATVANLFMLQGVKASQLSWNYPTWSISVEFAAYLLFGIAAAYSRRLRREGALLCLGVLGSWLLFFSWLVAGDFNQWDGSPAFARCVPEFFAGVLIYVLTRDVSFNMNPNVVVLVVVIAIGISLQLGDQDLVIVVLFAVVMPLVVRSSGLISRILNAPAIVLLGELSYALYLLHGVVQIAVSRLLTSMFVSEALSPIQSLALMIGLVVLSVLIAYCAHRLIEVPAREYIRRQFRSGTPGRRTRIQAGQAVVPTRSRTV